MRVKSRRPSGTRAIPCRHTRCDGTPARSAPAKRSSPARQRRRPATALIKVLFPAPFGPITATISLASTSSEASHTAGASP